MSEKLDNKHLENNMGTLGNPKQNTTWKIWASLIQTEGGNIYTYSVTIWDVIKHANTNY